MATRVPTFKYALIDSAGTLISFTAQQGSMYMFNSGPNVCYIGWESIPVAASLGDGKLELRVGMAVNLDDIQVLNIGAKCAAGQTANLSLIGLIRPGN